MTQLEKIVRIFIIGLSLHILSCNNSDNKHLDGEYITTEISDKWMIESTSIEDGIIIATTLVHGANGTGKWKFSGETFNTQETNHIAYPATTSQTVLYEPVNRNSDTIAWTEKFYIHNGYKWLIFSSTTYIGNGRDILSEDHTDLFEMNNDWYENHFNYINDTSSWESL